LTLPGDIQGVRSPLSRMPQENPQLWRLTGGRVQRGSHNFPLHFSRIFKKRHVILEIYGNLTAHHRIVGTQMAQMALIRQ